MAEKNGNENSVQKGVSDINDSCEEEDDEDIDEEESDESDDEELSDGEDDGQPNGSRTDDIGGDGDESDSDDRTEVDEETDDEIENQAINGSISPPDWSEPQCYICLNRFSGQDIGSPESCADLHHFCLDCIEEWSKQINTCPVDRKIFTYIVVRREIGSTVIMKLPIVKNIVPDIDLVPEDVTYCEICGRCDREDRLLLCDGCDFGYHCECLSPPIENIPIEEWFCPECYNRLFGPDTSTGIRTAGAGPSALQLRRAIARTGASEAVRQRILQRRTQPLKKPIRRKTTRRRKRKTYKRKTGSKGKSTASGTKKKRRTTRRRTKKRRKKRTKKSAFASRRLPAPTDPRDRIASKLGLGPPPKSPFGLPSMKAVTKESVRRQIDSRAAAGISQLSLFGTELDVYDPRVQTHDEDVDDFISQEEGGVGIMARARMDTRFIGSPVKRKFDIIDNLGDSDLTNGSSIDLLSQIMSSQQILHSSARDVRIARDGSLHLKRDSAGLPVRSCGSSNQSSPARSPASSSPAPSPPTSSPQRTDSSSGAHNSSFNYSFGSAPTNRTNPSNDNECEYALSEDISAVKPVITPIEPNPPNEESKVELYSDIESVGDNTRDNNTDADDDNDHQLLITTDDEPMQQNISAANEQTKDAIEPQSSVSCDPLTNRPKNDNSLKKTDESVDSKVDSFDKNKKSDEKIPTVKKNSKSRKPSIKDLFGDSSDEEEDDSDIRRLLAEQGSINVHYPIKMSIVLKNSITRKEPIRDNIDANKSSDQKSTEIQALVPNMDSEPAPDLSRWVTVHPKDGTPVPDSTTMGNKGSNKWKSIESSANSVANSVESIGVENNDSTVNLKPIETMNASEQVLEPTVLPEVTELQTKVQMLTTNETIDVNITDSELKSNESATVDQPEATIEHPNVTGADDEEGEIKDDDQKVRRCRHGRIRREKAKEREQKLELSRSSRHRSRSCDSKHRHKPKDKELGNEVIDSEVISSDVNVVSDSSPKENVEFKEKTFERDDKEVEEPDNSESVGWKKLSSSTKMRSYRDGKPKDEEVLFRERELQKKLVKKSNLAKNKPKDVAKDQLERHGSDGRRQLFDDRPAPNDDPKRKHRSETDKTDDSRRHKRKSVDSMPKHKRRTDERAGRSSSARRSPANNDEYNSTQESKERHKRHHKSSRHKHKEGSDRLMSTAERSHRSHRSSKHTHHSSKNKGSRDDDVWPSGTPQKILRDHTSYSDITPLDSKEIYAEGDRIVINVNFNREKTKLSKDLTSSEVLTNNENKQSLDESLDTRKLSSSDSKARVSSKKDESVFWASPPPSSKASTSVPNTNPNTGQTTTTITEVDDDMSSDDSDGSSNSSGSDRKQSEKCEIETKKDNKSLDDLRFLPRSLHQSDVRPVDRKSETIPDHPTGPHTPEGDYNEDQFMPTPTQDESQSPVRSPSLSISSRSSPMSIRSSPMTNTNGSKDDVYDPEAPLQSPDSHQSKASGRRSDPKSPDIIVSSRQLSKRSPQQSSRRQTSNHDSKSRHTDGQRESMPKSLPMTSTTHSVSVRSPYKSNPVPIQRQQSKPSPQKSIPTQHKSSSSLMPPPLAPTSRPSQASSIALTAATIASINPQNLAQLLQMAHVLNAKRQSSAQAQHQRRPINNRSSTTTNSAQNNNNNRDHSKDHNEVVDMDVESPSPPGPQQPLPASAAPQQPRVTSTTGSTTTAQVKTLWEQIIKTTSQTKPGISGQKRGNTSINSGGGLPLKKGRPDINIVPKDRHTLHQHRHQVVSVASDNKKQLNTCGNKLDQLTVLDDVPSSAVEMAVKEKFIKKLNRQERVIEEVKMVLKPYYQKRTVTKEEYKEILRKSVPKICHSRSGEINPVKIKSLIDSYIKRFKHLRKKSVKLPKK